MKNQLLFVAFAMCSLIGFAQVPTWTQIGPNDDYKNIILRTNGNFVASANSDVYEFGSVSSSFQNTYFSTQIGAQCISQLLGENSSGDLFRATCHNGIYRLVDGTWSLNSLAGFGTGGQYWLKGNNERVLLSKGGFLRNIYYSDDSGTNWTSSNVGNEDWSYLTRSNQGSIFACAPGNVQPGLIKSTDNGTTWSYINDNASLSTSRVITKDDFGNLYIVADEFTIKKSSDDGMSWSTVATSPVGEIIYNMIVSNNNVYIFTANTNFTISKFYFSNLDIIEWYEISSSFPAGTFFNEIKYIDNKLFVCASTGLFYSVFANSTQCLPAYVPTNGLVGFWPFCGNANDESGNGNDGNVNGAILTADRFGNPNGAFHFDGISNSIDVPHSPSLNFENSNSYSISYWINPEVLSNNQAQVIVMKQDGVGFSQDGWNSFIEPTSTMNFYVRNGLDTPYSGCNHGVVVEGQFQHVIQVFEYDSVRTYINGLQVGVEPSNGAVVGDNANTLYFGKAWWGLDYPNTRGYNGVLDDVGIWNRALTPQEVSSLYTGEVITTECLPAYVPTDNLLGYWPFCGNADDESGNGNHGAVNGSSWGTDRFGVPDHAASFDNSVSQYISTDIGVYDTLSFSLWYSCASQSIYYPTLLDYGNSVNANPPVTRYIVHIAGEEPSWINTFTGKAYIQTNVGEDGGVADTQITTDNQWHHLACVFIPNDSAFLYIDGVLVGHDALSDAQVYSGSLFFGRDVSDNAGDCFGCGRYDGLLDDIGVWNRALTPQEVASLYTGEVITTECLPAYVPTDNLMGYWPFCGNANDESGNGNNGTVYGASLTTDRFGSPDAAYEFDGISDFIETTNINLPDSGTISVWVNPYLQAGGNNTWTYSAALVDKNIDSPGNNSFAMLYNDSIGTGIYGQVGWSGDPDNMVLPSPAQTMNLFQWQHCVFTFSNGIGKIYWNGNLVYTRNGLNSTGQSDQSVLFGKSPWAINGGLFNGKLDDIGIWSRALSDQEVLDLYLESGCVLEANISHEGSTALCPGQSVALSSNTGANYSYQWYLNDVAIEGANDSIFVAESVGLYSVEITDGIGCIALSTPVEVTSNEAPSVDIIGSASITLCEGDNIVISANAIGADSYQWNLNGEPILGENSTELVIDSEGTYTLTVTNTFDCFAISAGIEVSISSVTQPIITSSGPTSFCEGDSVIFSVDELEDHSYQWEEEGNAIPNATSVSYTATQSGSYAVTVTNGAGCSSTSADESVEVYPNPEIISISYQDTDQACEGESVVFISNVTGANQWQWNWNGDAIFDANVDSYAAIESGVYSLIVSSEFGCSITSEELPVTIIPNPTPVITPAVNSLQIGQTAQFTVSDVNGSSEFLWQTNPGNVGWMNLPENGSYSGGGTNQISVNSVSLSNHLQAFHVTAANGNCVGISEPAIISILDTCITQSVVFDTLYTNIEVYDTLYTNVTVYDTLYTSVDVFDTLYTYVTLYDTLYTNTEIFDTLYTNVTVYDTIYTSVTDTLIIDVPTGLEEPNEYGTWLVYPNPANDALTINFGEISLFNGYSLEIYNSVGQLVYSTNVVNQMEVFDVSTWADGTYLISVINDTGTEVETKTLIIQ